jgi:hypothetical protein
MYASLRETSRGIFRTLRSAVRYSSWGTVTSRSHLLMTCCPTPRRSASAAWLYPAARRASWICTPTVSISNSFSRKLRARKGLPYPPNSARLSACVGILQRQAPGGRIAHSGDQATHDHHRRVRAPGTEPLRPVRLLFSHHLIDTTRVPADGTRPGPWIKVYPQLWKETERPSDGLCLLLGAGPKPVADGVCPLWIHHGDLLIEMRCQARRVGVVLVADVPVNDQGIPLSSGMLPEMR